MRDVTSEDPEALLEIVQRLPALEALREEPLDRRDLERRLDVSKSTSHRCVRALGDLDLVRRDGNEYALTELGQVVTESVSGCDRDVRTAFQLAPLLEATSEHDPSPGLSAFADATVTTAAIGDAYSVLNRFITLFEETTTLRGVDVACIAPLFVDDIQRRIIDGVSTVEIVAPEVTENVLAEYPEKCVEACASGNLDVWLHENPSFGLAIFDDRVGVGVRDPDGRTVQTFVDTDDPDAREWAEMVFESYREEAVPMEEFTRRGFEQAMAAW